MKGKETKKEKKKEKSDKSTKILTDYQQGKISKQDKGSHINPSS